MWFVYIVRCADDSLYIGHTADLQNRIARHNNGAAAIYTAQRRPVRLAYAERYRDVEGALARERQLKRWTRAKKEALVARDIELLKRL